MRKRIDAACVAAGRAPGEVALLAVTKTVPAADVATLLDLGLAEFGENRVQEAETKVADVAALRPGCSPGWHFVGSLQRNKARSVVRWAHSVESVDSLRLADALDAAVRREQETGGRADPLPVLLQYSVDGDPERGGVPREGLGGSPNVSRPAPDCGSTDSWRWPHSGRIPMSHLPTSLPRQAGCVNVSAGHDVVVG